VTERDPLDDILPLLAPIQGAYALIGGHAVNAFIEPRFTADIDITATVDAARRFGAAALAAGMRIETELGAAQASGPDFVRYVDDAALVIEIQAAKTAFQLAVVARAHDVGGVAIATPEDLLVLKAIANRAKDQRDLDELAKLPDLDWDYVVDNARVWGVDGVIDAVRSRKT
jgi:hypothetical protein